MKTKLGQANFLDINYELIINTLGDQEQHKCSHERNLKYDDFLYKRLAIQNEHDLNCSVPFHPPNLTGLSGDNINICRDIASGKKAEDRLWEYFNARTLFADDKPCSRFDVFLGLPDINDGGGNSNEANVIVYMKFEIKIKRIVTYYDTTSLAADIGGYIGMLLGFSIIDLVVLSNSAMKKLFQTDIIRNVFFRRDD